MTEQILVPSHTRTQPSFDDDQSADISLRYILFLAVIMGLGMNWLASYLKISMGFVSVGIGPMAVLLISRQVLRRKHGASRKNLTTILIAYGATQAAEASVGLLFLIWLATNPAFFGLSFVPPWWLLPSPEVIANRTVFTPEWIVPLLVHYFLMLVPGFMGLVFGWFMKDSFVNDDETYPFPGVINQNSQVGVLTDEAQTKGPLFWRLARWGFILALVTVLVPQLFIIDLSNIGQNSIFGIMLGPVGLALFAAGILIGKPKVSVTPFFVSTLLYTFLGIFLLAPLSVSPESGGFFDVFNLLLQEVYFVPALAIMLGGLIVGPIAWGVLFPLLRKLLSTFIPALRKPVESAVSAESESESVSETESAKSGTESDTESTESDTESAKKPSLLGLLAKNKTVLLVFTAIYVIIVTYVHSLQILPGVALWIVAVLMFWNIILGGMVNGYLYIVGTAKSNSAIAPPFIFDVLPIFLAGGTGFTSYVAMPSTESDGSAGIVSATKLGRMNGIGEKRVLKAYIAGYLATTVTTPIFALLMWSALGIGTAEFPAPAFPVQGAILASFASRDVTSFIDLQVFFIVMGLAVLFTKLGTDVFLGIVIGMLFPPHMAVPMALGGLTRILIDRRYDEEKAKDLSSTIGPGLAVGASFVIPIMIILALVL